MSNSVMIAVAEAREECKGKKRLRDRLLAAMKKTKDHWLVINEDERLQAAICATVLESNEDDAKAIRDEWDALKRLSSVLSGTGTIADIEAPKKTVGIIKLWQELKA